MRFVTSLGSSAALRYAIELDEGAGLATPSCMSAFDGTLAFVLFFWGLCLLGVSDAVTIDDARWEGAGQSKPLWVLVQLLTGVVGTLVYFFMIRPKLRVDALPLCELWSTKQRDDASLSPSTPMTKPPVTGFL